MKMIAAWSLTLDGSTLSLADVLIRLGGLLAVYVAFTLGQRFLVRHPLFRSVGLQLNLLVLVLLVLLLLGPILDQMKGHVGGGLMAATIFLAIALGLKLLDVLLFDWLAQVRKTPPVPLVVREYTKSRRRSESVKAPEFVGVARRASS